MVATHRVRCIAVLALAGCEVASSVAADEPATSSSTNNADSSSNSDDASAPPVDACDDSCADTTSDPGKALCYACRCKAAFDDWLPSREELQCSNAAPIVAYQADLSTPEATLVPAPFAATSCANTSLFTGSCTQGSKVGQLAHDDVMVRWICRDPYLDVDGRVLYADVGIVGQNVRTGVACFWDDVDDVTHEDDMPPLDLHAASVEERARWDETFYYTEGDNCTPCHDADPFVYTPYLQSTPWTSVAAAKGPYSLLGLDGSLRATGLVHLVSPRAVACTSCHRLGSEKSCTTLAPDALGAAKDPTYEQAILDAAQPGSPHWRLAYWMPETTPVADFAQWEALFADARAHILACCEAPGENAGDCEWAPIPGG